MRTYRKHRFAIVVLFEASGVRRCVQVCFVVAGFFNKEEGAINGQRLCVRVRARVRMKGGGGGGGSNVTRVRAPRMRTRSTCCGSTSLALECHTDSSNKLDPFMYQNVCTLTSHSALVKSVSFSSMLFSGIVPALRRFEINKFGADVLLWHRRWQDNLCGNGNWRGRTRIGQERLPNETVGGGAIRFIEARTMIYQPTRGLQNRAAVVVRVNCK